MVLLVVFIDMSLYCMVLLVVFIDMSLYCMVLLKCLRAHASLSADSVYMHHILVTAIRTHQLEEAGNANASDRFYSLLYVGLWHEAQGNVEVGGIRGTFRDHSENIQGTFREHSENI
jgi:hypothetical protein